MDVLVNTGKQVLLNRTRILRIENMIIFLIFIIIAGFFPIIFIRMQNSFGIVLLISLLPANAIVYSIINYSVNKSTLRSNLRLSTCSKLPHYFSTIINMIIVTIVLYCLTFLYLIILSDFDLLKSDWYAYDDSIITFNYSLFLIGLYSSIIISLLTFSISFALQNIVKNSNTYFIIVLSILILCVIFGATFNSLFSVKQNSQGYYKLGIYKDTHVGLFPNETFYPSLILPYYSPAQFATIGMQGVMFTNGDLNAFATGELVEGVDVSNWVEVMKQNNFDILFIFGFNQHWTWTLLFIFPYFDMVLLFLVGKILSKSRKEK